MNRRILISAYKKVYPNGKVEQFCKYLFKAIKEENGEGINFVRFLITISIFFENDFDKKLKILFKIFVADNKSNQIDIQSIKNVWKSLAEMHGSTLSEIEAKQRAINIFSRFNKNSLNDYLTEEEFINGSMTDPYLIIMLLKFF